MRISAATPHLDELLDFLREEGCIAYSADDGSVEVIPPPGLDPEDDWSVIALVRGFQQRRCAA